MVQTCYCQSYGSLLQQIFATLLAYHSFEGTSQLFVRFVDKIHYTINNGNESALVILASGLKLPSDTFNNAPSCPFTITSSPVACYIGKIAYVFTTKNAENNKTKHKEMLSYMSAITDLVLLIQPH